MDRIINEKNNYHFFFFLSQANASIILDFETEEFIEDIIKLITTSNNYNNKITFSIILDDNPNAFVNQNNKILISTGLLKYSKSYEAIVGVIAHEIGHIDKFHISKRINSSSKLKNLNNLANLGVIAGSLISNSSEYLIKSLVTKSAGIQNYYQSFSRDQEREADFYAIETLNKLNLSSEPLKQFLNYLEIKSIQAGALKEYNKFSSHPIYKERYSIIDNNKKINNYDYDEDLNKRYQYIRAKLFGFTEKNEIIFSQYLDNQFLIYAKSINLSTKGKFRESIKLLNNLIKEEKSNYFLLETKADIIYSNGFLTESLLFYNKSIELMPQNSYIDKRRFDINFSIKEISNAVYAEYLFHEFYHLLEIFFYNKILKKKFNYLANISKLDDWTKYFYIEEKFYNKEVGEEDFVKMINNIKNNTKDFTLKSLIDKHINNSNV